METIIHKGYFKYNNYKEYFELDENGNYIFKVYANHIYDKETKFDTYLKDGTFYKTIKEVERIDKQCTEIIEQQDAVIQIDFDFHLMPIGNFGNIDDLETLNKRLNNSFEKKFKTEITNSMKETDYDYTIMSKPTEINKLGHTRNIQSLCMDFILNFDIRAYKKRKDKFIKTLECEYLKNQCETIYYYNIQNLKAFFMCNEKALFSDKFNLFNQTLLRLNYNIIEKQKQNKRRL